MTRDGASAAVSPRRVLLVDDDSAFATEAAVRMKSWGYTVAAVWNCDEALKLAESERYDAVLLDNGLPGVMGIVALPRLIARCRAPVILISAHPSDDLSTDAKLLGASAFLPKPMDWTALADKLKELIRAV